MGIGKVEWLEYFLNIGGLVESDLMAAAFPYYLYFKKEVHRSHVCNWELFC